jgi:hypothetical protein
MEAAILLRDLDVVDRGLAPLHQAVLVELPLLVAIGAMPLACCIVPLVLKSHRDAVVVERPEILDQAIVEFFRPFAPEERDDRRAALKELRAIAPAAVLGVGERHAFGIARVPGVFRHSSFLGGGFSGERRKWRTGHDGLEFGGGLRV